MKLVDAILKTNRVNVNVTDPTHGSTPLGWAAYGSCARARRRGLRRRDRAARRRRRRRAQASLNKHGHSMVDAADGNPAVQAALSALGAV